MYYGFCRACNHRGAAKRPSTPSHSASRHSIFFSPRARSVALPTPGHHFPGAVRPLTPRNRASFFPPPAPSLLFFIPLRRFVASRRCAHSIIIIGFRSRSACALRLVLSVFLLPTVFPISFVRSFVRLHTLASVPNSITLRYELTDERGPARRDFSPGAEKSLHGDLSPRRAML